MAFNMVKILAVSMFAQIVFGGVLNRVGVRPSYERYIETTVKPKCLFDPHTVPVNLLQDNTACAFKVRYDTVEGRVPRTIPHVECAKPDTGACNRCPEQYTCTQMMVEMETMSPQNVSIHVSVAAGCVCARISENAPETHTFSSVH